MSTGRWLLAAALAAACPRALAEPRRWTPQAPMRVCVFHDAGRPDGRLHAIMLENLLGHFREVSPRLLPAREYRPGGLRACDRAAYVGSVWGEPLPAAFLREAGAFPRPFLWLNYGIDKLQNELGPEAFARRTGFLYRAERGFDPGGPPGGVPGFFRDFHYKGARLSKRVRRRPDGALVGPYELLLVDVVDARVLATAAHSSGRERAAYVTVRDGFYFVADNPFLFIHEQDRYLIVADLLFDFLGLPPRRGPRRALLRLEDVHPGYDLGLLYRTVRLLKRKKVPFAVSVIPKFVPRGEEESAGRELDRRPAFLRALRYVEASGGVLLLHGYTHHVPDAEGCPSLGSGADYEFWDRCRDAPLARDSPAFLRERVSAARALFARAGLEAVAWVTPHYAASPQGFRLFGRLFERTVQRVSYYADGAEGPPHPYVTQFFPYTVYRDHYGQFVWPENLGFVPMPGSDWGWDTPEDVAESARKAHVVRDGWASFFWHPQHAALPGGLQRLEELVDAIRSRGFTFVSLKELRARGE